MNAPCHRGCVAMPSVGGKSYDRLLVITWSRSPSYPMKEGLPYQKLSEGLAHCMALFLRPIYVWECFQLLLAVSPALPQHAARGAGRPGLPLHAIRPDGCRSLPPSLSAYGTYLCHVSSAAGCTPVFGRLNLQFAAGADASRVPRDSGVARLPWLAGGYEATKAAMVSACPANFFDMVSQQSMVSHRRACLPFPGATCTPSIYWESGR